MDLPREILLLIASFGGVDVYRLLKLPPGRLKVEEYSLTVKSPVVNGDVVEIALGEVTLLYDTARNVRLMKRRVTCAGGNQYWFYVTCL